MKDYNLKILSNKQVSERYWQMTLDSSAIKENISPGQFFNIKPTNEKPFFPLLRRPFSIYLINNNTLEFLYKTEGAGTQKLSTYTIDDTINILGPAGVPFSIPANSKKILLLARGVGIATLAALAQKSAQMGLEVYAILSARKKDDLLATETMENFCKKVIYVTEEEQTSDVNSVSNIMQDFFENRDIDSAYTCGSKRLSKLLQKKANKYEIYSEVALEEYMACGIGICYSCVCDIQKNNNVYTVKSCEEGPVFSLKEVILND